MIERRSEVRDIQSGMLGVVDAIGSTETSGPDGARFVHELCVVWDDGNESWCGEADVETTGYKRDIRRRVVR